jgi:hypothetical protein
MAPNFNLRHTLTTPPRPIRLKPPNRDFGGVEMYTAGVAVSSMITDSRKTFAMMLNRTLELRIFLHLAWTLIVSAGTTASTIQAAGPENSNVKTVRLMTIGNSFSRNATRFLDKLAAAGGHELIHRPVVVGGASMELHATKALKHQANPDDPAGKYADGSSLQERLEEQPWDVVTIQQASRLSPDVNTYRPFAAQLQKQVQLHAPQSRLLIHETWAYREDDPWFVNPSENSSNPVTQMEMHQKLHAAYFQIADELKAEVIPVGDAFQRTTRDQKWSYHPDTKFDFANATFPQLPNQQNSLHVGWRWRTQKGVQSLAIDGHHANTAGEYLGGCVFYEVLFQEDVTKNSFIPDDLSPPFAAFLRETAHRTVSELNSPGK